MLDELWITCGVLCVFCSMLLVVAIVKLSAAVCACKTDLSERVVLITGGISGIGLETARQMAFRGAVVIITCRVLKKGREALHDIVTSTGNSKVFVKKLNLSSLGSVRSFAEDFLASQDRLDILVNNAGTMARVAKTEDGLEANMAANYFGPFLLTMLLLPLLKKTAQSRIVMVADNSLWVRYRKFNIDRVKCDISCSMFQAYATSKQAVLLLTCELARVLDGTGVTVNSLHPGFVLTELTRELPRFLKVWVRILQTICAKRPDQGAQTTVHVAICEDLGSVSGKFFVGCRERELWKGTKHIDLAKQLWNISELLTCRDAA